MGKVWRVPFPVWGRYGVIPNLYGEGMACSANRAAELGGRAVKGKRKWDELSHSRHCKALNRQPDMGFIQPYKI